MISETALLEKLKNWDLFEKSIQEIKERINENTYRLTANYSLTPASGGYGSGKLENYCIRALKSKERLETKQNLKKSIIKAFHNANLTSLEKETVIKTVKRQSLVSVAERCNISQAGIYRIRNRAVKKMCDFINTE